MIQGRCAIGDTCVTIPEISCIRQAKVKDFPVILDTILRFRRQLQPSISYCLRLPWESIQKYFR
jgi:hypothetical protein